MKSLDAFGGSEWPNILSKYGHILRRKGDVVTNLLMCSNKKSLTYVRIPEAALEGENEVRG